MSILSTPPPNYLRFNSQQSKQLAVVVDIPGLDYFTSVPIGRSLEYGDPYSYGDPGLLYGGLVPVGAISGERTQQQLLDLDGGSLTIGQQLEPEQGRASISTLQMTFIDKDEYMTKAISPGILIPEILGSEVKVWLGYAQTSFPQDYYLVWRGRVAQTIPNAGRVTLQFTDPNIIRRQQIFTMGQTTLDGDIDAVQTTIDVIDNTQFAEKILGPDGSTYDQHVKACIKIDDEFIEYQQTGEEASGYGTNQFLNVSRGARGTIADVHQSGGQVDGYVELSGHAIDQALKIMLSGFNGPYLTGQTIQAFGITGDVLDPVQPNAIILQNNVDAVRDLGIAPGDFISVTGATNPSNDGMCKVVSIEDSLGFTNRIIHTDKTFTNEATSPAIFDCRSQYDTLPDTCGCRIPSWEVDILGHVYYRNTYLNDANNAYRFLISSSTTDAGKTFIESQIMLPLGAYCLTRQGKISMGLTIPPIADERTRKLDATNVIDPASMRITRGLNIRKFFNEIDWTFDYDDDGTALSQRNTLNTQSIALIGVLSVLPIDSQGARTDLKFQQIVDRRERFLFSRYANGSVLLDIKVNFGTGNLIEAGDVVIVSDNGGLQIPNLSTGTRDFGVQLMEVINRTLDLKTGMVQLQLQGGVGALATDRYATISPSSLLDAASTSSKVVIVESFGAIFPGQEYKKWQDYIGLKVWVHSPDFTRSGFTTFVGFDPTNKHALILNPALGFTPLANDVLDVAPYSTSSDPNDQALLKIIHAFLDPSVAIVSGSSPTVFVVGGGDAGKFQVGMNLLVHNLDYSDFSPEVKVQSVVGTTITVSAPLGFTPDNTMRVELLGFADFNAQKGTGFPYRFV